MISGLSCACLPWAAGACIVCFDVREMDGRIFSLKLPSTMNRESLLLAAGFPLECEADVHLGSSWAPLRRYQIATLAPGIMVTIMPSQGLFRPGASLPIMLLRTDRWVADPHVPDEVVGRSFMLLTDAMPVRLDASCTTRDSFRQDVATVVVFLLPRSACPIFLSRRDCPEPLATSASLTNAHSFGAFAGLLQREVGCPLLSSCARLSPLYLTAMPSMCLEALGKMDGMGLGLLYGRVRPCL